MSGVSKDEANGAVAPEVTTTTNAVVDEVYEFSAPKFYDFTVGESDEEVREAELWFETALSHAPSPFMPRIKARRSFKIESGCDLSEADQTNKALKTELTLPAADTSVQADGNKENVTDLDNKEETTKQEEGAGSENIARNASSVVNELSSSKEISKSDVCCTPKPPPTASHKSGLLTASQKHQKSDKQVASSHRNQSAIKSKSQSRSSHVKGTQTSNMRRDTSIKNTTGTPNFAQENQAIKRQKLDGGKSRQILNLKPPQPLLHKSKLGVASACLNSGLAGGIKLTKEERKVYAREQAAPAPFISTAELMKKFQSSTRDMSLPQVNTTYSKPKLTLTRPKEPEFETSQRVRSVKVKSTAELEEEMMAKIPKFKARPLNKKILEGPSLAAHQRSTPKPPEFHEFHFETSARANQNCDTASVASTEVSHQSIQWKPLYTEPKTPILHTSLRARPTKVKSSFELEKEEIEKVPKFKARPLNKKIFETKGEMGIFCNTKKQVTVPQEFHFATNERIPPPTAVADLFDKLCLNSEPCHNDHPIPKKTMPNPFHLHTDERGAEKERKFVTVLMQKQLEEERARVPKANPYPYTTDYPVFPPKPEPKPSTKPEPFQLESLVRHEEEMQREMEERQRKEKEEAQMRIFKAQPVLKEDPIPVPEKVRKPLTQIEQFNLHVDQRAPERAEFDQKVKEKEMMYKRYREESEAAKMIEEEKALKQMRRTMVPHARPIPNFEHPFCPRKSTKEATRAKSPNLQVLGRKERRKMLNAATSSPAFNMR